MKKTIKTFCIFFASQFLVYGLCTWNYRCIAQGQLGSMFVSDIAFATVNFNLTKRVAKAEHGVALYGYVLGGACGSVLSVIVTRFFYGL